MEETSNHKPNILQLRKMPAIAPQGQNRGIFASISVEPGDNATGNEGQLLKVEVELAVKNAQGVPYAVTKQYNLESRGLASFQKDFNSWSERKLTDEELNQFDADKLMKNKSVLVEIKHKKDGKNSIPVIKSFLPAPEAAPASA